VTDEGEGGLLNGHVVELLLELYQSIIVKKPKPENLSTSVIFLPAKTEAHIVFTVMFRV